MALSLWSHRSQFWLQFDHRSGKELPKYARKICGEWRGEKTKREEAMKSGELKTMSLDALWSLHERIEAMLRYKLSEEKARLDRRLRWLKPSSIPDGRRKRPYPHVLPKFQNPDRPSETWAGRGKQPRWLTAQLRSGKKLEDFRVKLS